MSAQTSDYRAIACIDHERLEFAVLRRQKLRVCLREVEGGERESVILPTDVNTREGAEWLSYRNEKGEDAVIRLDFILRFAPAA